MYILSLYIYIIVYIFSQKTLIKWHFSGFQKAFDIKYISDEFIKDFL